MSTPRHIIGPSILLMSLASVQLGCSAHDHYARGQAYAEQDRHDQAIIELEQAVKAEPGNAEYQTSLADARKSAADARYDQAQEMLGHGQIEEARRELKRALELSPGHPQATEQLAELNTEVPPGTVIVAASPAPESEAPAPANAVAQAPTETPPPVVEVTPPTAVTPPGAAPATPPSVALPESKAGQGIGTPPDVSRDMRRMPSAKPGATNEPVAPTETIAPVPAPLSGTLDTGLPLATQPASPTFIEPAPEATQGGMSFTLSREDDNLPKMMETLDHICVRLKRVRCRSCAPVTVDIEVRVDRIVKRYRELPAGTRITGRGYSHRPHQITIDSIDGPSETASFTIEPLNRLPLR
jgi:hypothetical protein